ncbi:class II fructose-bisphosphate aldolase [Vagococcus fluvialis]|uniref:class II fructose-bisphosphate aldolase n=1 Tax=Vagococcus fluvialis TaxID=2738 RepID=UPI001D09BBC1|nr:class II fructose-bisphosphate aldolase [Vagococcus fluvialis]UDM75410.1 class II fructose-bisphosphate aldolase [Vagococcus fluvialis]
MLVNSKDILVKAKREGYAVPAPNFIDLDSARVFVETAEKWKKPLILPFAQAHESILSLEEVSLIGKYLGEKSSMPVVLHLDHGEDVDFIKRAITLGFTSVMIDASQASFEENVKITKEVVAFAHQHNVTVEAELGHVGAGQNYENHGLTDSIYTEVEDVLAFIEQTNIDSLAISIGTAHGQYKGIPKLNFERLAEISEMTETPLVLHGGSSSGDDNLERCALNGISKINIFTDFLTGAFNKINENEPKDYLEVKALANEGMTEVLEHYFKVFHTK